MPVMERVLIGDLGASSTLGPATGEPSGGMVCESGELNLK